jgi:ribose/xylose/arabinose/galactoside ABC-type transport system permease subunit
MDNGIGLWAALLLCIMLGLIIGGANAVMIERFNLPPFLATLGTTFFLVGTNLFLRPAPGGYIPAAFQQISSAKFGDIPIAPVVVLIFLAGLGIVLDRSRFGLRLHAVGSDERRARLAGVPSSQIKYIVYIASAELALTGGLGTIWGAIIGAFVLGMISNVLNLLGVVAYWQWVIQGVVLILAVSIYSIELEDLPWAERLLRRFTTRRAAESAT